jgi:GR25 family glycosyltransferase involved in LPS biosynthesis
MQCLYINLDSATERRERLERNFAMFRGDAWTLARFPAVAADYVEANAVAGALRPAEKACYLSHRNLIRSQLDRAGTLLVLEDDATFGRRSCETIGKFLAGAQHLCWDIVYTDVCVPSIHTMYDLIKLRYRHAADGEVYLLDLAELPFAGSTAYILNANSKRKIFELLSEQTVLDHPYDIYLKQLIHTKRIKGSVLFPFPTSVSDAENESQIQLKGDRRRGSIRDVFRRMIWMDRDLVAQKPGLDAIAAQLCDEEARLFGKLFAAMVSRDY